WHHACDPPHLLSVEEELVADLGVAFDIQDSESPVHLASVALPGDRLLSRIAPLGEADVRLVEPGFRREDALVDLGSPARDPRLDAPALELFVAHLVPGRPLVEHLAGAEHDPGLMLLRLDLDLGRKARSQERGPHRLAE